MPLSRVTLQRHFAASEFKVAHYLFFRRQLLNRWLRGRPSPADLARPRASRKPYWKADVRHVRERTVRYPDPNFGS
jgi:hypothetical protein